MSSGREDDGWLLVGPAGNMSSASSDVSRRRVILPPFSRKIRHLNGIFMRNVRHSGSLLKTFYRLYRATPAGPQDPTPTDTGSLAPQEAPAASEEGGDAGVPEAPLEAPLASSDLLYESEVISDTLNPTWRGLPPVLRDMSNKSDAQCTQLLVVVHNAANEEVICRTRIDLASVRYVCSAITELRLPVNDRNRVLLEFHDGIFVPSAGVASPMHRPASLAPQPQVGSTPDASSFGSGNGMPSVFSAASTLANFEFCVMEVPVSKEASLDQSLPQSLGDVRCDVTRLVAVANALAAAQRNIKNIRSAIAAKLEENHAQRQLMLQKEQCSARLLSLRSQVEEAERKLKEKQEKLIRDREKVQAERKGLQAAREMIKQRKQCEEDVLRDIKAMKDEELRRVSQIENRKKRLVRVLRTMFPIKVKVNKVNDALTICGLELGRDNTFSDEAATALGYVTHCIQLLACVWGVSLRYTVFPIGSRSYIQETFLDGTAKDDASLRSPLFCTRSNQADRQRCVQSVMLLNSNLRQLLQVRHLSMLDPKQMLFNLKQLLETNPELSLCDGED
eukprot:TRINITY_DN33406_c1_g3_i1.p1 TRINITY_DN33406_c1_g3~~TRINITY_DN33406_c1_g3_i1.p1  ORF type:complete len:562 (+),score=183.06 TRINITY_DN33406_c1_g3_i1:265-1950(+)